MYAETCALCFWKWKNLQYLVCKDSTESQKTAFALCSFWSTTVVAYIIGLAVFRKKKYTISASISHITVQ